MLQKSDYVTKVKPSDSDIVLLSEDVKLTKVIPSCTVNVKSSLCKRGPLKNTDRKERTHYLKLDCTVKNKLGQTIQVFNRFILLDKSTIKQS